MPASYPDGNPVLPDAPFADLPIRSPTARPRKRAPALLLFAALSVALVGAVLGYHFVSPAPVDPDAPRVRLEVRGMHCPLQCGLRVRNALESLPWVVTGSVTADPRTGVVTFAVTDVDAVAVESVRRAIERAGFGLAEVRLPRNE
jgi:hypothetical protein